MKTQKIVFRTYRNIVVAFFPASKGNYAKLYMSHIGFNDSSYEFYQNTNPCSKIQGQLLKDHLIKLGHDNLEVIDEWIPEPRVEKKGIEIG